MSDKLTYDKHETDLLAQIIEKFSAVPGQSQKVIEAFADQHPEHADQIRATLG